MKFSHISQPEGDLYNIFNVAALDCHPSLEVKYGIFHLWHLSKAHFWFQKLESGSFL